MTVRSVFSACSVGAIAITSAYPAITWTDITNRQVVNQGAAPAFVVVTGNMTDPQRDTIVADSNFYLINSLGTSPNQSQVDALVAWLVAHGVDSAVAASYVSVNVSFQTLRDNLIYYSKYGIGVTSNLVYHVTPATFAATLALALPGDTLYLAAGAYPARNWTEAGCPNVPLTIRAETGARATFDGGVTLHGNDLVFRDLEFTNTDPARLHIASVRPNNIEHHSPRTKVINCYIHDGGLGVGWWEDAVDTLLYGCVINNVGWTDTNDTGTGHGIYTQNDSGLKTCQETIFGPAYYLSFQCYGSNQSSLKGYRISGCCFCGTRHVLGGFTPVSDMQYNHNFTYDDLLGLGYAANHVNLDGLIEDNVLVSSVAANYYDTLLIEWDTLSFQRNTLVDLNGANVNLNSGSAKPGWTFDHNTYYNAGPSVALINGEQAYTFAGWKARYAFDANSTFTQAAPTGTWVYVRPNAYDPLRANVFIYNWDSAATVLVDLSSLSLPIGNYLLRNAADYYDDVFAFTYTGQSVNVPMIGHSQAKPIGAAAPLQANTFPQFGAFVLERLSSLGEPVVVKVMDAPLRRTAVIDVGGRG